MGVIDDIRKKDMEEAQKNEPPLSGFEINVHRMEGLLMIVKGDVDRALEIVKHWLAEAKKRYDAKH